MGGRGVLGRGKILGEKIPSASRKGGGDDGDVERAVSPA